jgi:hypothetical protein
MKSISTKDLSEDDWKILTKNTRLRSIPASENLLIYLLQEFAKWEATQEQQFAKDTAIDTALQFFGTDTIADMINVVKSYHDMKLPTFEKVVQNVQSICSTTRLNNWTDVLNCVKTWYTMDRKLCKLFDLQHGQGNVLDAVDVMLT